MLLRKLLIIFLALTAACTPTVAPPSILVSLVADGRERKFEYQSPVTVAEFLRDAEIEKGELDRVTPPEFTQITDGMRVTVVRVSERTECSESDVPYTQRRVLNEGLEPGEERLGQAGQNGREQICYRVNIEDNVAREPVEISRVELVAPQDEVIYVGPTGQLDPVTINGTLAYISGGNAWVMRENSTTKRPLTTSGDLDRRVFSLSPDGRRLLLTRDVQADRANFLNQLWLIAETGSDREPVQLVPEDVLYADWIPNRENTISYSTGEARQTAPGWQAFNDLWTMRIDPETGEALTIDEIVEASQGGLYGWWGTAYEWSPDGDRLAWVRADSVGLVNTETGDLDPLLQFPLFNTRADWSWRSTVSWSPDGRMILTTAHGAPVGSEPPEFSPVFNVAVTDFEGSFQAEVFKNTGIWSLPKYSPLLTSVQFPTGYLAYFQARDIANSINSLAEYDLIVADRDGSNVRRLFPAEGQPGVTAPQEMAWSPDGRQIALIYQGNLWIVDVESGVANQLTLDGGASKPVWAA